MIWVGCIRVVCAQLTILVDDLADLASVEVGFGAAAVNGCGLMDGKPREVAAWTQRRRVSKCKTLCGSARPG